MPQQQSGSYHGLVGFGLLGLNASATVRVISRFGWVWLLGLNASATVRVISRFGWVWLLGLNASGQGHITVWLGLVIGA